MKHFFRNLLDRHLGNCATAKPRSHLRFETEGVDFAAPFPINPPGSEETGEEILGGQDISGRIPKTHSISQSLNTPAQQGIYNDRKLPDGAADSGTITDGNTLKGRAKLFRPPEGYLKSTNEKASDSKPQKGPPVLPQHNRQSVKPKAVDPFELLL